MAAGARSARNDVDGPEAVDLLLARTLRKADRIGGGYSLG